MLPRSFYFVRHGETDWNRQERMQGWTDIPLNETGRAQAMRAIDIISHLPIDLIVSSTMIRAHETAKILNTRWQKDIITDIRLRERGFGDFEGKHYTEMDAWRDAALRDPALQREENGFPLSPGAEPYPVFKERTMSVIAEHLDAMPGKNILFVAHGGLYRVLNRHLIGATDQSPNVQPFHFEKNEAGWVVHTI